MRLVGNTVNVPGARPIAHCIMAELTTSWLMTSRYGMLREPCGRTFGREAVRTWWATAPFARGRARTGSVNASVVLAALTYRRTGPSC